jgi:hypothetical protein
MTFKTEYNILYLILFFIFAFIISYIYYKKTNLTSVQKISLICLRTSSIFLALLLLMVSYVNYEKNTTERPLNIFLFDNSSSMFIENRQEELKESIGIINNLKNNNSENIFYIFSGDIDREINIKDLQNHAFDSTDCESTNLSKTLNSISKKYADKKISSVNIISDGIINEGGSPINIAQQTNSLFNYFLIGDTNQRSDLAIRNIFFNNTTYTGSSTQILVEFNSYNFNKIVKINLYEEDNLVQTKDISLNKENTSYNYTFNIKSYNEGIKKYKVELEKEPGEISYKNNEEEFFIKYLDNKFKILVLSGNPSPDFSYLSESIKSISNFEGKFFTQKAPGVFYEGLLPSFDEFNLLLLINFPNSSTDFNLLSKINDNLKSLKLPLFFVSGSNTDYEKLKILIDFLPVTVIAVNGSEVKSTIKSVNELYSETYKYFNFGNTINNLPEIYIPGINIIPRPETGTILYSSKISKPVLICSFNKDVNSAAFFAYDFYKWRLNNENIGSVNVLEKILSETVLSLCNKEKNKKISFDIDKQVYSPYETIKINGFINSNEPAENETVSLQVFNDTFSKQFETAKTSVNSFTGEIKNLIKGEYNIKCALIKNGTEIGNDTKKILVKESNLEFKNTKAESSMLNNLSILTGGERISELKSEEIRTKIAKKNENDLKDIISFKKVFLNSSIFILILFIVIFSIEWYIRKNLNLP